MRVEPRGGCPGCQNLARLSLGFEVICHQYPAHKRPGEDLLAVRTLDPRAGRTTARSEPHRRFRHRRDSAADFDPVAAIFTQHPNVKQAATLHFSALFTDEGGAGGV
jgi:hypothetical protein